MNRSNSTAIIIVVALVILGIAFALGFLGTRTYGGYHGWGMMGPWMWGGMFFMWLIPLALVILAVLGVVWLVQNAGRGGQQTPSAKCPSCGQSVQTDWKNCPHCGTSLTA